ncbi:MAG: SRPBCC family protein [Actinobacteria bacterium]|nr:SRPBCC family protein [Actinomycetota bacterium]
MAERTSGEITINASADTVMDVIADLPAYPQWSDGMEEVVVLESYPDGRPKIAKFFFNPGPIADTFILSYMWDGSRSVSWILTEGTVVKAQEGTYTLAAQPDGSLLVTYQLMVELSIPMIGKIRSRAEKMIVKTALAGLKKRVETSGIDDEEDQRNV